MKITDYISVTIKKVFRKKSYVFSIFLIALSILVISLTDSLINSINIYFNNAAENNLSFRTLFVYDNSSRETSEVINELSSYEHVISVVQEKSFVTSTIINDEIKGNLDGQIMLYGINNDLLNSLVDGKKFDADSNYTKEIICPITFYPNSVVQYFKDETNNIIDGSNLLNKKLNLYFRNIDINEEYEVIGLYDSLYSSENICYTSFDNVLRLNNLDKTLIENHQYIVFVDKQENIQDLQLKLLDNNYYSNISGKKNNTSINKIASYGVTISIFTLIFAILIILFSDIKAIEEKRSYYANLKVLGYNNKNLLCFIIIENLLIFIFGFILSLILFIISLNIIKHAFRSILFLKKTPIIVNYKFFLILFIILLIISLLVGLCSGIKIKNINIIKSIKE